MKRKIYYIVYDTTTLKIIHACMWFGKDISRILSSDINYKFINVTNPQSKSILENINNVNGTNYS